MINEVIQPFFRNNINKLPNYNKNHFLNWSKIDEFLDLWKQDPEIISQNKDRIKQLITDIYYVHAAGLYRSISISEVLEKVDKDSLKKRRKKK